MKIRGYNQSVIIGDAISEIMKIPLRTDILLRIRETPTQTKLNRNQRWMNMENAFVLHDKKNELKNKHVILIDDVVTTGATLEASAIALMDVPGINISIATLGYALVD